MKRASKYRKGRQLRSAERFPIEFNACAYAAFAYVAETSDPEDAEDVQKMMETLFDAFLESPSELNL